MEQVKRFGAGVLASVLAVSMLQTMVFAVYCWAQMGILHLCTG